VGPYHSNHGLVLLAVAVILLKTTPTNVAFAESGVASVYSNKSGNRTASGQLLNLSALTAAHRSLAFGTKVRVSNPKNGRSVDVTINDRGPFVRGRIIDVTPAAARELGFSRLAPVTLEPKVATTPAAADFRR
jgi:rare lipoprotein A